MNIDHNVNPISVIEVDKKYVSKRFEATQVSIIY